jgi:hypothetical protein
MSKEETLRALLACTGDKENKCAECPLAKVLGCRGYLLKAIREEWDRMSGVNLEED